MLLRNSCKMSRPPAIRSGGCGHQRGEMYDDGTGMDHKLCVTCYMKYTVLTGSVMIMVIGNRNTQHVTSYGYCAEHAHFIINEFNKGCIFLARRVGELSESADDAMVKWSGGIAYFL
jgi:hypothetical protein